VRRYVDEGETIPPFYGVSHRDFARGASVCYPVGLHALVRWGRDLRAWVMWSGLPGYRERQELEWYRRGRAIGYDNGLKQGYVDGWQGCAEKLLADFDAYTEKRRNA
jgi:hypothetical protein